jgi:hypothetical protein
MRGETNITSVLMGGYRKIPITDVVIDGHLEDTGR